MQHGCLSDDGSFPSTAIANRGSTNRRTLRRETDECKWKAETEDIKPLIQEQKQLQEHTLHRNWKCQRQ